MSKVIFWSPFHGQSGCTTDAILAALFISSSMRIKTLLMHSQYYTSNLESAFLADAERTKLMGLEDIGIDGVHRLTKANLLTKDNFRNYSVHYMSGRLDILPGTLQPNREVFIELEHTLPYILYFADKVYDVSIIDVNSGLQDKITNSALKEADIAVVNLNQNLKVLDTFFNDSYWKDRINTNSCIINIGNYSPESKCSLGFIENRYKLKKGLFCTPHSTALMDAHNSHDILKFYLANKSVDKTDPNFYLVEEVSKLGNAILELSKFDSEFLTSEYKKETLVQKVRALIRGDYVDV